jgi:hypothetical protein
MRNPVLLEKDQTRGIAAFQPNPNHVCEIRKKPLMDGLSGV